MVLPLMRVNALAFWLVCGLFIILFSRNDDVGALTIVTPETDASEVTA